LVSWNIADRIQFRTQYNLRLFDWDRNGGNPHEQYMQKDWIFPHTPDEIMPFIDTIGYKNKIFEQYFCVMPKYETNHQIMLTNVLSLQSTLKSYGIPYTFVWYRTLLQLKQFKNYYNKIDWNYVHPRSLFRQAKNMNMWDEKTLHPTDAAYRWYADEIYKFLSDRNLIKP